MFCAPVWYRDLKLSDRLTLWLSWIFAFSLSLLMIQIGREIQFWCDHADWLTTHPLDVWLNIAPWLVLFSCASLARIRISNIAERRIESLFGQRLFEHIVKLFPSPDNALNRLVIDIPTIAKGVTHVLAVAIRHAFFFTISLIMMCVTSWFLTCAILACVPIWIGPVWFYARFSKKCQLSISNSYDQLTQHAEEALRLMPLIQTFGQEIDTLNKWSHTNKIYNTHLVRRETWRSWLVAWIIGSAGIGVLSIILIGAQYTTISLGELVSFVFYASLCVVALSAFNNKMREWSDTKAAIQRVYNILDEQPDVPPIRRTLPKHSRGVVAFHHVRFAYPNHLDRWVLDGVTFSIHPGEFLAIVGPSGGGKSTIFSLLLRFYRPQVGRIHFDGIDIDQVDLRSLRARIGHVPQNPELVNTTVYDNILYGNPNAAPQDIKKAIDQSGVGQFLSHWPKGEHTLIGDIEFSGGQKQCIALARVLVRKPSLFLLDEPTSSLDSQHESLINEAFKSIARSHTTCMITHRASTFINAHRIIMLQNGRIEASGNHGELVSASEAYRSFVTQDLPKNRFNKV